MSVFRLVSCITVSSEPNIPKSSPRGKYKFSPEIQDNLAHFAVHQEMMVYSLSNSQNPVPLFAPGALRWVALWSPGV